MSSVRPFASLIAVAFGLAAAACAGASDDAVASAEDDLTEAKLGVASQAALPVAEVSGLGRRTVGGNASYLAVPDAEPTLVTFDVDARGKPSKVAKHDLSSLFGGGASQWEAVAGDSSGSVFILTEASDTISVLAPDLKRIVHTIQLSIPKGHALSKDWKSDANSHGEGMVLLANGHVLVVKEKNPVALIEFAVDGEVAQGYDASLALADRAFKRPSGASSTMSPVHHWLLKSSQLSAIADVSEVAVDADGRLLLLSDQGRSLVRVERGLRADEDKMDIKSIYRLPAAVDKPEGLVMAGGVPLVGIDQQDVGDSLFTLEALP
jgi:hypothetical protein